MRYIIGILLILAIVISLNTITCINTNNSINEIENKLNDLKDEIDNQSTDKNELDVVNLSKRIDEIITAWGNSSSVLSLYIEHDELEKAEREIVELRSNIDINDYEETIKSIDTMMFQLEHIKDKNKFNIKNIF